MIDMIKEEIKIMLSNGRINRTRFMAYQGLIFTCIFLGTIFTTMLTSSSKSNSETAIRNFIAYACIIGCVGLQIWWLSRRINDTNKSSKWIWKLVPLGFFLILIPALLKILGASLSQVDIASPMYQANYSQAASLFTALMYILGGLLTFGIASFVAIIMVFASGTKGANKFGKEPPRNNYLTNSFAIIFVLFNILIILNIMLNSYNLNHRHRPYEAPAVEQSI